MALNKYYTVFRWSFYSKPVHMLKNIMGCCLTETILFRFDSGSLFTSLIPHLDDVSSKAAPQPLLFRVVELIVRQIPGIFNLRLGHILDQSKTKCHKSSTFFTSQHSFPHSTFCFSSSHLLRFIFDDARLSQQNATFFQCRLFFVFFRRRVRGSLLFFIWDLCNYRSRSRFHVHLQRIL